MDDIYGKVEVFPNHFQDSEVSEDCPHSGIRTDYSLRSRSHSWVVRRVMGAACILNLFSLPRLPWTSNSHDDDKVELTSAEVEALRSEIVAAEEREAHLKAQLEHLDEILKSAWLSGYLHIRTRWTESLGDPPRSDDADVDDWLPRFAVLHGSCIYYYIKSTDLSPQDSTLLSDVVEVGPLPSFTEEDSQQRYAFYILTCNGLRFECQSLSKAQVDSWLAALCVDRKLEHGKSTLDPMEP